MKPIHPPLFSPPYLVLHTGHFKRCHRRVWLIWQSRGWRSLAHLDMCYFWKEPCLIEGQHFLALFNMELLKVHFTWLPIASGQIGECKKRSVT